MAFINGRPSRPTATVHDHWLVQLSATMLSTDTRFCPITFRAALTTASNQSSGLCSAPPLGSSSSGVSSNALATTSPRAETSATFGPDVPRSTARMYLSALIDMHSSCGCQGSVTSQQSSVVRMGAENTHVMRKAQTLGFPSADQGFPVPSCHVITQRNPTRGFGSEACDESRKKVCACS